MQPYLTTSEVASNDWSKVARGFREYDPDKSKLAALLNPKSYLTTHEVAALLQVSPDFVRSLVHAKKVKCVKLGRVWRFKREAIEAFLQKQER